jgi:enoyl-CoA hydratase
VSGSAEYSSLEFERIGDVLRVTLANPRNSLNAIDEQMHTELTRLFDELRREESARAVVLTGSGRAFSAGGDLGWISELKPGDLYALRREAKQIVWNLLDVELPIVAAINGHAVGLGATLALLCDVIYMAESATLADPHVRAGIVAGDGGVVAWPLAIGPARAKRYLLTGDSVTADEALELGLVNSVVADSALQQESLAFAERLAAAAPLALRFTKLAVNQLVKQAMATAFDYSTALEVVTFLSTDHAEALRAMRMKQPPRFEAR